MLHIILTIICVYGICNILSNGSIFNSFREYLKDKSEFLHTLITCPMCLGFWVGIGLGLFYGPFAWWNPLNGPFYSATTWMIHCIIQFFGAGYDPSRTINVIISEPIKIQDENKNEYR
jgi:hypothetical protein